MRVDIVVCWSVTAAISVNVKSGRMVVDGTGGGL